MATADKILKDASTLSPSEKAQLIDKLISTLDKSDKEIDEWMLLDTFDMFSPSYDKPQRLRKVRKWFIGLDFINVEAEFIQYDKEMYAAVVKGTKA